MGCRDFEFLETVQHIGVYPFPENIPVSNLLKGYLFIYLYVSFIILEFLVSLQFKVYKVLIPEGHRDAVRRFFSNYIWSIITYFINQKKIKLIISGDIDLLQTEQVIDFHLMKQLENAIVISNHRSLFDFILIYYIKTIVERRTNLESINLKFFNWNEFWSVPKLTLFWQMVMNDENWFMNYADMEPYLNKQLSKNSNNWIVLFPEVNILTERTKFIQNQQGEKYYLPKLMNVLYPRFANFNKIFKFINSKRNTELNNFRNLIDFTILYYNPIKNQFINPTLFEILTFKQPYFIIYIDMKVKSINKLPTKPKKLEKWLENNWCEKDKIIDVLERQFKI